MTPLLGTAEALLGSRAIRNAQTHRRDRTRNLAPALRNSVLRVAGKRIFKANHRPLLSDP
jgi:hypothetical protein